MAKQSFSSCTAGDPKFWPAYIRHIALANICFFVFLANMYAAGITTGFVELAEDFHTNFGQVSKLVSYPVLALGVGNIIWTPTAICLGKRPVVITASAIFLICCIWSIKATTIDSLLASRILACFAAGSIESIGPALIADLYMERYFATSMAVFSLFLSGGAQVGPMIAGFLIQAKGWRWFFKLCAILIGVNLLLMLPFLPETNYRRVLYEGETASEVDKLAQEQIEHDRKTSDTAIDAVPNELNVPYAGSYWKDLVNLRNRGTEESGLLAWPAKFSLPFRFILVPHGFFAALSYGVFLGGVVMISTITPQLLSPPPYLFTSSDLGLLSLASFLGIIIGYPIAGPLTDLLSRVTARVSRNKTHLPEHRIPALIAPFLIAAPGLLLFAYTISHEKSVYVAAVGYAMQISAMVFVPSVVLSVLVDAYPANGSEALVLVNAGKNAVAFGITASTPTWLVSQGLVKMLWEMAAIQWAVLLLAIPLFFFGPWMRLKTLWLV